MVKLFSEFVKHTLISSKNFLQNVHRHRVTELFVCLGSRDWNYERVWETLQPGAFSFGKHPNVSRLQGIQVVGPVPT